ncbi:MAG: hypothetical protein ACI4RG_11185 [Huintestinicola sp.]
MKLYDVIINSKECSEDESIKNYAELLNGNPIGKVTEEEYRKRSVDTIGYDPTTVYDFDRIDKTVDKVADNSMTAAEIDELKSTVKTRFVEDKDNYVRELVDDEISSRALITDDEEEEDIDNFDDDDEDSDGIDEFDSLFEGVDGVDITHF